MEICEDEKWCEKDMGRRGEMKEKGGKYDLIPERSFCRLSRRIRGVGNEMVGYE